MFDCLLLCHHGACMEPLVTVPRWRRWRSSWHWYLALCLLNHKNGEIWWIPVNMLCIRKEIWSWVGKNLASFTCILVRSYYSKTFSVLSKFASVVYTIFLMAAMAHPAAKDGNSLWQYSIWCRIVTVVSGVGVVLWLWFQELEKQIERSQKRPRLRPRRLPCIKVTVPRWRRWRSFWHWYLALCLLNHKNGEIWWVPVNMLCIRKEIWSWVGKNLASFTCKLVRSDYSNLFSFVKVCVCCLHDSSHGCNGASSSKRWKFSLTIFYLVSYCDCGFRSWRNRSNAPKSGRASVPGASRVFILVFSQAGKVPFNGRDMVGYSTKLLGGTSPHYTAPCCTSTSDPSFTAASAMSHSTIPKSPLYLWSEFSGKTWNMQNK